MSYRSEDAGSGKKDEYSQKDKPDTGVCQFNVVIKLIR